MQLMNYLRRTAAKIAALWRHHHERVLKSHERQEEPTAHQPDVATPPAPPPEPSPQASQSPQEDPPPQNRHTRRALKAEERKYLRNRLKFDKFVEPQGPEPIKMERSPSPRVNSTPSKEPEVVCEDAERMIVDHYDDDPDNPEVLYEEKEFFGQFRFRDTILDQLDRYWFYLERMRRHDADAFGFYKQVGMNLLPYSAYNAFGKFKDKDWFFTPEEIERYKKNIYLPPAFNVARPAFGCIAYAANPKFESWEAESKKTGKRSIWPRFMYYVKYTRPPPTVQMMRGGDVYSMTIWWDSLDKKRKWGVPQDFAVFINRKGTQIQILKTCEPRMIPIREKHSLASFEIPDKSWRIPHEYEEWAKDHGLDAQTYLAYLFTNVLRDQEEAQFGDVRIAVHKDDLTAIFHLDSRRLAYFFQDRDIELTDSGLRKRMFHVVRPFIRSDGVAVKMHYRGERHFTWAGYDVNITVPGLDHFMQDNFDIGVHDGYWIDDDNKDAIRMPEIGSKIVKWMDDGLGGHHHPLKKKPKI